MALYLLKTNNTSNISTFEWNIILTGVLLYLYDPCLKTLQTKCTEWSDFIAVIHVYISTYVCVRNTNIHTCKVMLYG